MARSGASMVRTDEELVARATSGDLDSFNQLVSRWERPIYALAYRTLGREEDARDVVQEAFLRAYRGLRGFKGEAKFSSWLYRITLNLCRDWIRRDRRGAVGGVGGRGHQLIGRLREIPGVKIVAPAFPADAKALLRAAIDDDNPVLFFEHKRLYGIQGEVNGGTAALGQAAVVRVGRDITLVSAMKGVHDCLEAAETLAASGIEAEVIDLRTLRPLDAETVLASVVKTNRIAVVEEGPLTGGWAGEVLALATERGLGDLDDAWRITTPNSPIPYSPPLEDAFLPGPERIVAEIRERVRL